MVVVSLATHRECELEYPEMRNFGLLVGAVAATLVTLASTVPLKFETSLPVERSDLVYRLPEAVVPHNYSISLVPYLDNNLFIFTGTVSIEVSVINTTNVIIVHAENLTIDQSATILHSLDQTQTVPIATQTYDEIRHFYILSFAANLPLGDYNLTFSFSGHLLDNMMGFYRSSYQVGGETRWLASTQFQPTSARRAFPCFDEPGMKATFKVRIAHFANQVALSNMPALITSDPDPTIGGRLWTEFDTTPVMSTYILAFVVSDFVNLQSTDEFFKIWSRNEAVNDAAWALETTQQVYQVFLNLLPEDPWTKIDQVAVPDFSAGAMENWGLITYRERLLLWRADVSSTRNREAITYIISHELAHIWFGNLVSPKWWDHLWFNEGLASFFEWRIPSLTNPQWRFAERAVTEQQLAALVSDSLETTRAMTNVVGSPASILASFDTIAYSKSAAVFRMLNRVMREDLFETALSNFLTESAFGTFNPDLLWQHMQTVADSNVAVQNHISIAAIMDTWVNQPGFPLVTVLRNYSTTVVAFSQERFFMNPKSPTADPESQRWWIPITLSLGTNPSRCNSGFMQPDWLRAQDKAIMINGFPNDTWVLANCQGIGFYRTNYDTRNWEMLADFLKSPNYIEINPINRAILIDDALNLARAGYIEYPVALNLVNYLEQETDFVVWRSAIRSITFLNSILARDENFEYWQDYLKSLISNVANTLGWEAETEDDHSTRLHRAQIFNLACQINLNDSVETALTLFDQWIEDPAQHPIDPDLKPTVYCWGARNASEETWDIMWNRFLAADVATEVDVLLVGLACSHNPNVLQKYLQFSITPNSGIRLQDTYTVFSSILNNGDDNIDVLLDFVTNNTAAIAEFYDGFNTIASMLVGIAGRITRQDQFEKLQILLNTGNLGASESVVEHTLQSATENLEWISNNGPIIENWLREEGFIPEPVEEEEGEEVEVEEGEDSGATMSTSTSFFILSTIAAITKNYYSR